MKTVHRHVNKALKLRHHKHTGKVLAHKHTSYRVLFALVLVPAFALPLVDNLSAYADEELSVTATVPAPIPPGIPTISSPVNSDATSASTVTVSGTCPVISPAIIVAIYRNLILAGSVQCDGGGQYSVPITLQPGENNLVATVVTITDGTGGSSTEVLVTYSPQAPVNSVNPAKPSTGGVKGSIGSGQEAVDSVDELIIPLQILAKDIYVLVGVNGQGTWRGSFAGGMPPYEVTFNWGDGTVDRRTVRDVNEQVFTHNYETVQTRALVITMTDANGESTILRSTVVTPDMQKVGLVIDRKAGVAGVPGVVEFIHTNALAIYIATVSALVFLWYIEHGRHILSVRHRV